LDFLKLIRGRCWVGDHRIIITFLFFVFGKLEKFDDGSKKGGAKRTRGVELGKKLWIERKFG